MNRAGVLLSLLGPSCSSSDCSLVWLCDCCVEGFKPGQRKVVFTCLKRNLTKEIKVAQLAGSVAEHSAYHHGEVSCGIALTHM